MFISPTERMRGSSQQQISLQAALHYIRWRKVETLTQPAPVGDQSYVPPVDVDPVGDVIQSLRAVLVGGCSSVNDFYLNVETNRGCAVQVLTKAN